MALISIKCLNMVAMWRVEAVLAYNMAQLIVAYKLTSLKDLG